MKGVELGINGYLTDIWEITANYTHLNDKITASSDPLSLGKFAPNTPHDAFNLWSTRGTHAGLDGGRRLHRRQPSLCGHREHRRRAGVCGVQCDDLVPGQSSISSCSSISTM